MGDRITLLVIEDHPLYRYAVKEVLCREADIEIVGEAALGEEALALVGELRPQLALLDLELPDMDGLALLGELGVTYPDLPVLILSARSDPTTVWAALEGGACGYLSKELEPAELVTAVRAAASGEVVLPRRLHEGLAYQIRQLKEMETPRLTARETEILVLAAAGHAGPEIARRLYLSPATVKTHFASIYQKLGVADRAAAVAEAMRRRLVS